MVNHPLHFKYWIHKRDTLASFTCKEICLEAVMAAEHPEHITKNNPAVRRGSYFFIFLLPSPRISVVFVTMVMRASQGVYERIDLLLSNETIRLAAKNYEMALCTSPVFTFISFGKHCSLQWHIQTHQCLWWLVHCSEWNDILIPHVYLATTLLILYCTHTNTHTWDCDSINVIIRAHY